MRKKRNNNIINLHKERKKRVDERKSLQFYMMLLMVIVITAGTGYYAREKLWRIPGFSYTHIVTAQPAYLLDRPHNFGTVWDIAPINTEFTAFYKKDYWFEADYNGKRSYLPMNYMILCRKDENGGEADYRDKRHAKWKVVDGIAIQKSVFTENGEEKILTANLEINMRETGALNGRILTKVPKDGQLMLIEKGPMWYRVFYAGTVGYVHKSNLTESVTEKKMN